jgi:hypothetical protein
MPQCTLQTANDPPRFDAKSLALQRFIEWPMGGVFLDCDED